MTVLLNSCAARTAIVFPLDSIASLLPPTDLRLTVQRMIGRKTLSCLACLTSRLRSDWATVAAGNKVGEDL